MCDTVVNVSLDGVLFAKNSDRDANESQVLEWSPAALHDASASVRCTWIEIPQISRTNAVLLSRPWWMWGAEMGANEHGVVIGNEAVFTNQAEGEPALLGMDLLRLALERASDARGAAQVIIELLTHFGQGGSCSYEKPGFTYHNSFLIADACGAVVLETAGDRWATEEVKSGVRSISNGLTIPSFAQQYSNRLRSTVAACKVRRARTEAAASDADGPAAMMATLRDHGDVRGPRWSPINGTLRAPCVHAGGLLVSSQTTASLVSDLRSEPLHWATATSAPCTSIFKPVRVDEPVDLGPLPTNRYDPGSVWWQHERLHRRMLKDYSRLAPDFQAQRDQLEARWVAHPPSSVDAFSAGERLDEEWLEHEHGDRRDRRPSFVRRTWRRLDATAAMSNGYGVNLQR